MWPRISKRSSGLCRRRSRPYACVVPDGTGALADEIASRNDRVRVLHRPVKEGLGPAYIAGFRLALAEGAGLIVEMDSDFPRSSLPTSAAGGGRERRRGDRLALRSGRGRRRLELVSPSHQSRWSAYARRVLGVRIRDMTAGFRCYRLRCWRPPGLDSVKSTGYAFQVEMAYRAIQLGFKVVEIPIVFRDRQAGASKIDRSIIVEAVWRVPMLRLGGAAVGTSKGGGVVR
jgi:dolichol-phosphate mannosyltransferase